MPNIVASRCTVIGPAEAVARFRADCIRQQTLDATAPALDFEAVLPSPEILHGVRNSSAVSDGLAVLGVVLPGGNPFEVETLEGMLAYPWVRQAGITTIEALNSIASASTGVGTSVARAPSTPATANHSSGSSRPMRGSMPWSMVRRRSAPRQTPLVASS
jgi:hypothetical protein